jgi:uncharacterized membrane protein
MDWESLRQAVAPHRYKILGSLVGLVFALLVIRFGWGWALFILFCTGIGYWVGKLLDDGPEAILRLLERIRWPYS